MPQRRVIRVEEKVKIIQEYLNWEVSYSRSKEWGRCSEKTFQRWLTDVTEFKWYEGVEVHKLYLSAILDLFDRCIVVYVLGDRNDNPLVFKTFDKAAKANPDAYLCSTAAGVSSTPAVYSSRSWRRPA